ncbi:MAG: type II secretion system GspH family protein [Rectinema sp.]|nr:type II secretion system GspH family protein [Rectinema sp.]
MSTLRAFTLVELLIVIAVIAVLAAMLLPAISMVRESARMSNCASNLRQIVLAFGIYRKDEGQWPCRPTDWDGSVIGNYPDVNSPPSAYDDSYMHSWKWINFPSATFEFVTAKLDHECPPKLFVCPSKPFKRVPPAKQITYKSGNASWLGNSAKDEINDPIGKIATTSYAYDWAIPVNASSDRAILGDRPWTAERFLHKKNANIAFADGRVEVRKIIPGTVGARANHTSMQWYEGSGDVVNCHFFVSADAQRAQGSNDEDNDNVFSLEGDTTDTKKCRIPGLGPRKRAFLK